MLKVAKPLQISCYKNSKNIKSGAIGRLSPLFSLNNRIKYVNHLKTNLKFFIQKKKVFKSLLFCLCRGMYTVFYYLKLLF